MGQGRRTYRPLRTAYPDNLEYGLRLAAAQTQAGDPRSALQTFQALRDLPSASRDPRVDLARPNIARRRRPHRRLAMPPARRPGRRRTGHADPPRPRPPHRQPHRLDSGDPQTALAEAAQAQQLYLAAGHRQGVAWALNELPAYSPSAAMSPAPAPATRKLSPSAAPSATSPASAPISTASAFFAAARAIFAAPSTCTKAGSKPAAPSATATASLPASTTSGNVLETLGDLPRARQHAEESLEIRRQLGDRRSAALALSRLANIRRRQGELRKPCK